MKDVIEESKRQPVLIDFWAPWCGPCKQLTPILEKAVKAAKGKVKLVKMNIDEHPAIPGQMGIQSIPAVIAFVNGQPVDGFMGAQPESQVTAFIERLTKGAVAGETEDLLAEADAALAAGDAGGGGAIYAEILAEDKANIAGARRPRPLLCRDQRSSRPSRCSPRCRRPSATTRRRGRQAALDLAEQATSVGPVGELEQKVAANPLDHQARFDLAVALNAGGKRAGGRRPLMAIVKRDRKWNDDGARKQLVQFFEAWGPTDEATGAAASCRRSCSPECFLSGSARR